MNQQNENLAAKTNCDAEVVKAGVACGAGSGSDGFGSSQWGAAENYVEERGGGSMLLPLYATLPNGKRIIIQRQDTRREWAEAHGRYEVKSHGPVNNLVDGPRLVQYLAEHLDMCMEPDPYGLAAGILGIKMEHKWEESIENLWTNQGKNHALDNYFDGTGFTATPYLGLISSVTFTAVSTSDSAAGINGANAWKECDGTSAPNYSIAGNAAVRGDPAWAVASAGQKAISPALGFLMSGAGTVQGCFMATVATKSATSGILITAGAFGSPKVVGAADTLNVSWSASL